MMKRRLQINQNGPKEAQNQTVLPEKEDGQFEEFILPTEVTRSLEAAYFKRKITITETAKPGGGGVPKRQKPEAPRGKSPVWDEISVIEEENPIFL